ncbi:replication restart helicase PriA [Deinococcus radiophilus]|uniref:Probable replication restart protein PriA n=1 Tax=Deinococcus radiophilus TaxID=32062 RepID=A0A3S0I1P5_9DEIO|nr:primosomal protein N' [Deinococcus radiophilus]RTR25399.1 primosomal protein N' [Deinococcus radiophilus]
MSAAPAVWKVALPRPIPAYDFAPPHGHAGPVPVGGRALVPWHGEPVVGLVVGAAEARGAHRLREAVALLDPPECPWVHPATVQALAQWVTDAHLPLGLVWSDLLGVGWEPSLTHRVRAVAGADLTAFAENAAPQPVPGPEWSDGAAYLPALLDAVREQGLLEEDFTPLARLVSRVFATGQGQSSLTPKQREAAEWLAEYPAQESLSSWARGAGVSTSVVAAVLAKGHAELRELAAPPPALPDPASAWTPTETDRVPQAECWRVSGGKFTGRMRALAPRVLSLLREGGSVLVLAPEHATLERAWSALSGLVAEAETEALLFSGLLSSEQRERAWQEIQQGQARLVIGSYLALSVPLPDLKLVIVLDEGSDAYKLPAGSRAWVPDVAQAIARAHGASLGTAGVTPAVETVKWPALELASPRVRLHTVDYSQPPQQPELGPLSMPGQAQGQLGYPLSHDLSRVLRQVQERGRQAALLAPRRGYSALLRCPQCEHVPHCPNCDVALRFHQQSRGMACHQCGYKGQVPHACEECGAAMWQTKGPGTEWIAQEVSRLLPGFPVYRLDKDHQDDLAELHAGAPGVVVGTQLLLSQPAPPELALVGITLADTWLNISDFRASERYHTLLWELAEWHPERAPLLLVQTFQGGHPALQAVGQGQSVSLYPQREWEIRQALGYPPHLCLAQVEVAARDRDKARSAADQVAAALHGVGAGPQEVLGPAPAPIARVRGMYPYHLLLRARSAERLRELLTAVDTVRAGRIRVDVSPRSVT